MEEEDKRRRGDAREEQWEDKNKEIEWEILEPKEVKKKVRKPVKITCWFGDEEASSSSSSEGTVEEEWQEVDRRKVVKEKKMAQEERRKKKKHETAKKARSMMGIGPIGEDSIEHFEELAKTKDEARKNGSVRILELSFRLQL